MSNPQKYWFKVSDYQSKVGFIVGGWYDGLLQVKEEESERIYIVAQDELEPAEDRSSFRGHDYECGIY